MLQNDILMSFRNFFVRSPVAARPCQPTPFCSVLQLLNTIKVQEKFRLAVVQSQVQRQSASQFLKLNLSASTPSTRINAQPLQPEIWLILKENKIISSVQ
jgi:hypothetical protein